MIVTRFCDDQGKPIVARGTCRIDRYAGKDSGWFPIESFNFGFTDREDDKEQAPTPQGAGGKPAGKLPALGPKKHGGKGGKGDGDFAKVTIDKVVDATSISLMMLVMEERKSGVGGAKDERKIEVDIHVVSTVSFLVGKSSTFTSLLIHLEAVNVLGWSLKGSGDLRPSESVTLRYDRAAMIYNEVAENQSKFQYGPRGWDQTECEGFEAGTFRWDKPDYKDYLPP